MSSNRVLTLEVNRKVFKELFDSIYTWKHYQTRSIVCIIINDSLSDNELRDGKDVLPVKDYINFKKFCSPFEGTMPQWSNHTERSECIHSWKSTIGFSSIYVDCMKCGAKQ